MDVVVDPAEVESFLESYLNEGDSLKILVAGKTGVGKSSLINSIYGADLAKEGNSAVAVTGEIISFTANVPTPCNSDQNKDSTLTIWDSPGFGDAFSKNAEKTIQELVHVVDKAQILLYCFDIRTRLAKDDSDGIVEITKRVHPDIWRNAVFVLTFCNELYPPDDNQDRVHFFAEKFESWVQAITKVLRENAEVPDTIVNEISIVACGYRNVQPPGYTNWYTTFWASVFKKIRDHDGQSVMLKLNYNRLKVNDSGSKPDLSEVEFQGAPSSQEPFQLKVNLFGQIDIPGFVTAASATPKHRAFSAPSFTHPAIDAQPSSRQTIPHSRPQPKAHPHPANGVPDIIAPGPPVSNLVVPLPHPQPQAEQEDPPDVPGRHSSVAVPNVAVPLPHLGPQAQDPDPPRGVPGIPPLPDLQLGAQARNHPPAPDPPRPANGVPGIPQPHPQLGPQAQDPDPPQEAANGVPGIPQPVPEPQGQAPPEDPPPTDATKLKSVLKGAGGIATSAATGALVGALVGIIGLGFGMAVGAAGGAVVGATVGVITLIVKKIAEYIKKKKQLQRLGAEEP